MNELIRKYQVQAETLLRVIQHKDSTEEAIEKASIARRFVMGFLEDLTPIIQSDNNNINKSHPEDYCQKCKGKNTTWFADNDIWNKVMKGESENIVCPRCFLELADKKISDILIFKAQKV